MKEFKKVRSKKEKLRRKKVSAEQTGATELRLTHWTSSGQAPPPLQLSAIQYACPQHLAQRCRGTQSEIARATKNSARPHHGEQAVVAPCLFDNREEARERGGSHLPTR
jgi:hypothetical protein